MPQIMIRCIFLLSLTFSISSSVQAEEEINPKKAYALLIACDQYDDAELRPLRFSKNDILSFQNILLESQFPADNLVLLHGDQPDDLKPTGSRIQKQLDEKFKAQNDALLRGVKDSRKVTDSIKDALNGGKD